MTPEEIASDYHLPLEAVLEAISYCESNPPELAQDYAREEAIREASGHRFTLWFFLGRRRPHAVSLPAPSLRTRGILVDQEGPGQSPSTL